MKERVSRVVQEWKSNFFSCGGKKFLIKSVARAIPTYVMSCFRLPKFFFFYLSNTMARFLWGTMETKKTIHWMSWERLCWPKELDGLSFRDLEIFSMALLTKQLWRFIKHPSLLVSRIIKDLYAPDCSFLEADTGSQPSYFLRGVIWSCELLKLGRHKVVGDGTTIEFFEDP